MVSKCANPNCAAAFLYFHTGRLFRLETGSRHPDAGDENGMKNCGRQIEFYWLCDDCDSRMTLDFEKGVGVSVRPKFARSASAA
jgi:hypothetical protein